MATGKIGQPQKRSSNGPGAGLVTLILFLITAALGVTLVRGYEVSVFSKEIIITAFSVFASATVTGALFNFGSILRRLTRDFEEIVRTADQINEEAVFHWTLRECDDDYLDFEFEYTLLVENRSQSSSFEYLRQSFAFPVVVATAERGQIDTKSRGLQVNVFRGKTRRGLTSPRADVTDKMFFWTNKELGIFKLKFSNHRRHQKIWYRVVLRGYAPKRNLDTLFTLRPHNRVEVRVTVDSDNIFLVSRANQRINTNFESNGLAPHPIEIVESFDSSETDGGRARVYAQVYWSNQKFPASFIEGVKQAAAEGDDQSFFD